MIQLKLIQGYCNATERQQTTKHPPFPKSPRYTSSSLPVSHEDTVQLLPPINPRSTVAHLLFHAREQTPRHKTTRLLEIQ